MPKAKSAANARPADPIPEKASGETPADTTIQGPVFGRTNYILFAAALFVIVVGFVTLAQGSITLAPILLVVGYLVLVPMAIVKRSGPAKAPGTGE